MKRGDVPRGTQADLFAPVRLPRAKIHKPIFGTDPVMLVRTEDPDTSHEAAEVVDTTRLEEVVYRAIVSFGPGGCISDEVQARLPELRYGVLTPRFAPLIRKGLVIDTGERRKARSGRRQRVMRAVQEGA